MSILSFYYRYRAIVRGVVRRAANDRAMQDEMDAHLAQAAERYMSRGMSAADARDAARREFGNVAVLQEEGRDARGLRWIESVIGDLRFAFRQIARRPLASATIVAVLALGIGVNAGIFSFLQAITVRPAPGVRPSASLVLLRGKQRPPERGEWAPRPLSYPEYLRLAARTDLFAKATAWTTETVTLDFGDPTLATSAQATFVTGSYFGVAGVRMRLGRALAPPDGPDANDGEMAAVIGDGMWRDLFAESPDVIGRTIRLNDAVVRIVGVAPPRFNGLTASGADRKLWLPLATRATIMRTAGQPPLNRDLTSYDRALFSAAALLAPGVSVDRASAAVSVISDQAVARMIPTEDHRTRTSDVVPLRAGSELPVDREAAIVRILLATVGILVLLVACTNVSALVVGAGVTRAQEIAIRLSLGASRSRLIRQLITESCVLALFGGVAGLGLYALISKLAEGAAPTIELAPDLATASFTLVFALATGILFGLSPALHATRSGVAEVLKGGGAAGGASARTRLQSWFIVAQIAVTQPLLVAVAVMLSLVASFGDHRVDESVSSHVVRVNFALSTSPALHAKLHSAMRDLERLPGITRVTDEPNGIGSTTLTVLEDSRGGMLNGAPASVSVEQASPGYFSILDIPILRGRDLMLADTAMRDLAIVIGSEFAHDVWGNADPIGRRFQQVVGGKPVDRRAVVVGVFDETRGTTRGNSRRVFAIDNSDWRDYAYLVRTTAPAQSAIPLIRAQLRAAIPELPLSRITTLEDAISQDETDVRHIGEGAGAAGGLVLLLASIGLYGVIGLTLAQRRREIGVRIALGALPRAVVGLLFRQGLRLGAIGLAIGLPLSVALLALLNHAMPLSADGARNAIDPALIGGFITAAVLIVTSVATWLPARKAARVDPMIALRSE